MPDTQSLQWSFWLGVAFVFIYTFGQYTRHHYREYFQTFGLGGAGLIIVWWFFGTCPAAAVGYVFRLLIAAAFIKTFFWLFYKTKESSSGADSSTENDLTAFSSRYADSSKRYKKADKGAGNPHFNRQLPGSEHHEPGKGQ